MVEEQNTTNPADPVEEAAPLAQTNGSDAETPRDEHTPSAADEAAAQSPAETSESQQSGAQAAENAGTGDDKPEEQAPFVSAPSTQLLFRAPDIKPLPARPAPRDDSDDEDESGSNSRRRSRKRRGGDQGGDNSSRAELITEPQKVKGSTRLEAKKQRRRDGRDAGRRRAVVTEAEFLARRESVDRKMIVRSKGGRIQIGVLEDDVLAEHYVARSQESSLIGNVYLGKVQNVLRAWKPRSSTSDAGATPCSTPAKSTGTRSRPATSRAVSSLPSSPATRSSCK